MIATTRLLLACIGLGVVWLGPPEPDRHANATYISLLAYIAYSGSVWLLVRRGEWRPLRGALGYWVDIGWYSWLIGLSNGTLSVFFFGFFFAILAASFGSGFQAGMLATVGSVVLYGTVGYATIPPNGFELDRFILRPVYLLILGYMVAQWGERQLRLIQRLRFLRQVSTIANPRFGIDRTIGDVMERLRAFYDAELCLIVTSTAASDRVLLRRCTRAEPDGGYEAREVPSAALEALCAWPPMAAAAVRVRAGMLRVLPSVRIHTTAAAPAETLERSADVLGVSCLLTVPWPDRSTKTTRLYVGGNKPDGFDVGGLEFLEQVIGQLAPVLENIRLVDHLASDAADVERQRIARDLHDSIVQPYIGLQLGLTAISRKLQSGQDVVSDVRHLADVVVQEIGAVRRYMSGLGRDGAQGQALGDALRRFADRFQGATGIAIAIETASNLHLSDRLAAEVFQIVVEGVSNARRHTRSTTIAVRLCRQGDRLVAEITDTEAGSSALFVPRSLAERAAALGGWVSVEPHGTGHTVRAEIPL